MQFNNYLSKCIPVNENGIAILTGTQRRHAQVEEVINLMGEASAKAQSLKQIITSTLRFNQTDQRIYLKVEGKQCLGMLKVGKKNLFYRDYDGNIKEIQPLCVLDFYVHESVQRNGVGKQLFEEMLMIEKVTPNKLAYDRPSPKLLGFLKKHYNLQNYVPQNNNYVVYHQYFEVQKQVEQQKHVNQLDQLDVMMQQMSIQKKPQQQYQMQSPWATDVKLNNQYQTTTGMMSTQSKRR